MYGVPPPSYGATAPPPQVGQGLLIVEATRSNSDTPHSVGLLWASDQTDAETSTLQHTQETDIHTPGGIRTRNPNKRAAADPHLRSQSQCDRLYVCVYVCVFIYIHIYMYKRDLHQYFRLSVDFNILFSNRIIIV